MLLRLTILTAGIIQHAPKKYQNLA